MNSEWERRRIGQLGRVITGKTPSTKRSEYFGGGIPFITIPDMHNQVHIYRTERTLTGAGAETVRSALLPADSVMMSCIATIGRCGITTRASVTNQQINSVVCSDDVHPRFLYYTFRQLGQQLEAAGGGGSVYTNVSKSRFSDLTVPLPPLAEQKAIAHILGTLDDKIEVNRRMNETLEAMARAVFKSWFVDFDPVRAKARAKANGTSPEEALAEAGISPHLAPLFPDEFEDSPLGPIPKGWEVKKVGDVCEFAYGKALRAGDRIEGPFPVMGSNGVVGLHNDYLVEGPGIIVGRKGNPGTVVYQSKSFYPIDTTFYVKHDRNQLPVSFLFLALASLDLPSLSADSAVPGLNRNIAYMTDILLPPADVLARYEGTFQALQGQVRVNLEEGSSLAGVRDTLLPKLLSGEVRVKEAEAEVAEVE